MKFGAVLVIVVYDICFRLCLTCAVVIFAFILWLLLWLVLFRSVGYIVCSLHFDELWCHFDHNCLWYMLRIMLDSCGCHFCFHIMASALIIKLCEFKPFLHRTAWKMLHNERYDMFLKQKKKKNHSKRLFLYFWRDVFSLLNQNRVFCSKLFCTI
jgi:hypothetical protein